MSGATKENVQLLRAVMKHPVLYDRNEENYRKRLPSENSWDMVASEVGGSVEKCKRRWRQLRNDYNRWLNADANRRRQGQRRFAYPLAEEFRFLDRHLNFADNDNDEERSASEKDRDSNRDSESRDNTTASLKGDAALDDKSVNDESLINQLLGEEDTSSTKNEDKDKPKEKPKQKKGAQEKSEEKELDELQAPERRLEEDSYLQSDQEGDEPIEEEHLEQLEDFQFEEEEELLQEKEKEASENTTDSPASQSEFFIKQNKEPHLLIIGKKNSAFSSGDALEAEAEAEDSNQGDPLDDEDAMEESIDESTSKILGRRDSVQSPSRRLRRIKDVPIKKPTQAPRVTRLQRTKSMTLAAGQSMRSSTSPVKMTPVPRPMGPSKSVQVKRAVPPKDGHFSRPAAPSADGRLGPRQSLTQSQLQRQQMMRRLPSTGSSPVTPPIPPKRGRPPKKVEGMQQLVSPPNRQQSPITPNVLPVPKPSSSTVNTGTNIANKGGPPTTNTTGNPATRVHATTSTTLKPLENVTVMSYSPISSSSISSPAGSIAKTISRSSPPGVATSAATASVTSVPLNPSLPKRCERTTQTDSAGIFSDEHFLEMIKPQMKEMNARQKMHFKKKVFQALMEIFDDATDFPEAGELQHLNINTPSDFEHVTSSELRLVRELVSLVVAAKVSDRGQPQPQPKPPSQPPPKEGAIANSQALQRAVQTLSVPRHLVQRVYKPGPGPEATAGSAAAPGGEKKLYRFLQTTNGKPNGNISASLEDLRKDSVDSEHSVVSSANIAPASPKRANIVAAVRPQGSSMNTLFGPSSTVTSVKTGPSLKARAMARRYSTCNTQVNNSVHINQNLGYPSSLNTNLTPMEASALKRRLMGPIQPMTPPTQRPRYSAGPIQQIVTPQGKSLLVRKPILPSASSQKQQVSPTGGVVLTPQRTPQITNVQGAAFKDFVQPKPTAAASPASSGSSTTSASLASPAAGEGNPQSVALQRSLVVANAKASLLAEKPPNRPQPQPHGPKTNPRYASMTAATIAADDFSLASLKREPVDHLDDQDDILGM